MSLKSPVTYGEWYWKLHVDALSQFDENIESAFAPYFAGLLKDIPEISDLPSNVQQLVTMLAEPPSAGFGGFALGVGVETVDEILRTALEPMLAMLRRALNRRSLEKWISSIEAHALFQRGKIQEDFWKLVCNSEGYEDIIAKFSYLAQQPYPTIPEIILWARYHTDPDNIFPVVQEKFDVDATDFQLWEWLAKQRLTIDQAQILLKRELITDVDFYYITAQMGWTINDRDYLRELAYSYPNAMLFVQGDLLQGIDDDTILRDISRADIHPNHAQTYLDAVLTKPSSTDIIAFELRQGNDLANLDAQLRKIGIHPEFWPVYRTLAYQIPPVADIITMAVREAFSPEIAARFGQYEDFPKPLETFANMKGLSPEWAQRYWAAHWSLPSVLQGFEMLHRGVISETDLHLLLRAQDVMPFWRDKLTKIAYRRLTRVDIRRMYRTGVLTEQEVYEAYLEHGYNDRDAQRMTEFTVVQTLQSLSKFTSSDIVKAFTQRMISKSDAMSLLQTIGIKTEDANYIVATAEYKRQWQFVDEQIAAIKNLYKKHVYDENMAISKLNQLDLPADQITVLMQQWYFEVVAVPTETWTVAQTLSFLKKKLIDEGRAMTEIKLNGYDDEHARIYIQSIK